MFLESRLKSYGKRVGNTRYICRGLEHQPALARHQANCWTAPWHRYKSPLLAAHVPGSWLGLAICPASFRAGRQAGRHNWGELSNEGCCDHSWCHSLSHHPPFPLPPHWALQIKVAGTYHLYRFWYSLFIQLLSCCCFLILKFSYPCAKGKTSYFHHPFPPRTRVHILIDTLLRHIKVFLNVGKE